ncbi:MAG: hypothetical protein IRY87_06115 [Acetobacteraceae bacterium]|nr:hypothetical protein [Acetobacteraceae bacterium]
MGIMLRLLIKLLLLVVAIGIAIRLGLLARLMDALPGPLQNQLRLAEGQADALGPLADPGIWSSPAALYEFLGSLPAPWGGLASGLLVLTGIALVLSLVAAVVASFARMLRWLHDMMI